MAGFHLWVLWPKCTPLSKSDFIETTVILNSFCLASASVIPSRHRLAAHPVKSRGVCDVNNPIRGVISPALRRERGEYIIEVQIRPEVRCSLEQDICTLHKSTQIHFTFTNDYSLLATRNWSQIVESGKVIFFDKKQGYSFADRKDYPASFLFPHIVDWLIG